MENEHTIAGLIPKRAALAGQLEHAQLTAQQLIIDLDHLDATIRLFQPDADLEMVKPKPYPPRNSAFGGEVSRIGLGVVSAALALGFSVSALAQEQTKGRSRGGPPGSDESEARKFRASLS